jgi:hypothetical protein
LIMFLILINSYLSMKCLMTISYCILDYNHFRADIKREHNIFSSQCISVITSLNIRSGYV